MIRPKANWILALAGLVILAAAYYLAVSIEDPVVALGWFFVAVVMVIIATYLLFIAGSVAMCRLLQKNKKYYYKTSHFVSISSMSYRMKRNGAGLATICILCTMVLVMLSSTVCLYIGAEDALRARYPRNIDIDVNVYNFENYENGKLDKIRELAGQAVHDYDQTMVDVLEYRNAAFSGYLQDGRIILDDSGIFAYQSGDISDMREIVVLPLEEYNRLMNQEETLEPDEVLLYITKTEYKEDTIAMGDGEPRKIKKIVSEFIANSVDTMEVVPSVFIFVPDFEAYISPLLDLINERGNRIVNLQWYYGFDLPSR